MSELTSRQQQVLGMLVDFQKKNGYPPTNVELASMMGVSSANAAADHLKALQKKGVLTIIPNVSRGIILNHKAVLHDQDVVNLIRALVNGDADARENAIAWLERHEVKA